MLLAIDAGNTNIVFAVYKGEEQLKSWRIHTEAKRSCDEYASILSRLFAMEDLGWDDISAVMISSVVPDANRHLRGFCEGYLSCDPVFVSKDMLDIPVHLDKPEEAGADRLVNAVAVRAHYQTPAIVIDFGTATTFDVIEEDGAYSGGLIAPGIHLSIDALNMAAAKLPKVSVQKTDQVIGKSTVGAIQSGIFWGYIGMIEGIVARIRSEMDGKPFVIATGGLASLFVEHTDVIDHVDDDLTLKGLFTLYQKV